MGCCGDWCGGKQNDKDNEINLKQKEYFLTSAEKEKIENFFTENKPYKQINNIKIPEIKVKLENNLYLMYIEEARNLTNGDIKDIKDFAQNYNVTKIHNKNKYFSEENKYGDIYLIKKVGKEKINNILNTYDVMTDKYLDGILKSEESYFNINSIEKQIFSKIDDSKGKLLYYYFLSNGKGQIIPSYNNCTEQKGTEKVFSEYDLFPEGKNFTDFQQEIEKAFKSEELRQIINKNSQKNLNNENKTNNLSNH